MVWTIQVKHADGSAANDARVALLSEPNYRDFINGLDGFRKMSGLPPHGSPYEDLGTSCQRVRDGAYQPKELISAEAVYVLVVNCTGHSPVMQRLRVETNAVPVYAGLDINGNDAHLRSWCLEIKSAGNTLTDWTIDVALKTQSEVVLLAGNHEKNKKSFTEIAEARRNDLVASGTIDQGTLVTFLSHESTGTQYQATYVRAVGDKKTAWMRIHYITYPHNPANTNKDDEGDAKDEFYRLSFTHLYYYLDSIGARQSQNARVREVSVFTHSWRLGPIFVDNTSEGTYRRLDTREPIDLDARSKDFSPPQTAKWGHMREAMAAESVWHIWGCSEYSRIARLAASANYELSRKRDESEMYLINPPQDVNRPGEYEEWTSIHDIRRFFAQELSDASYAARCAKFFRNVKGLRVIASAPGTWATPLSSSFEVTIDVGYESVMQYLRREYPSRLKLTSGIDGMRYIDYSEFQGIPIPASRVNSAAYFYHRTFDGRGATIGFYGWRMPFHDNFPETAGSALVREKIGFIRASTTIVPPGTPGSVDGYYYQFSLTPSGDKHEYVVILESNSSEISAWCFDTDHNKWEPCDAPLYLPEQSRP